MSAKGVIRSLAILTLLVWSFESFSQAGPSRQQEIVSHQRQVQRFLKEQRPDLAIPELRAVVGLDPNNVDARGNLGVLLFFQGEYRDAVPQLRAALKLQPTLWKIQALLGMSEKRSGDIKRARADLEKAFPKLQEEKTRIETGMELVDSSHPVPHQCRGSLHLLPDLFGHGGRVDAELVHGGSKIRAHASGHGT